MLIFSNFPWFYNKNVKLYSYKSCVKLKRDDDDDDDDDEEEEEIMHNIKVF